MGTIAGTLTIELVWNKVILSKIRVLRQKKKVEGGGAHRPPPSTRLFRVKRVRCDILKKLFEKFTLRTKK